jgi:hypothetical protein
MVFDVDVDCRNRATFSQLLFEYADQRTYSTHPMKVISMRSGRPLIASDFGESMGDGVVELRGNQFVSDLGRPGPD